MKTRTFRTREFTPERIEELRPDEVFVFGSNLNGNHAGGAARLAAEKFGAIEGQAEGLQGQSYAIPTLDESMQKLPIDTIRKSFEKLYEFANENPDKVFLVTKVGCGIAGFEVEDIATMIKSLGDIPFNIILPMEFSRIRGVKGFDKNMKCRGEQYSVNQTAIMDGPIKACERGFHFCENPAEALHYYNNIDDNQFAEVVGEGEMDTRNDDTKIAVSQLSIGAKIDIQGLVSLTFDWMYRKRKFLIGRAYKIANTLRNSSTNAGGNSSTNAGGDYSTNAGGDSSTNAGGYYSTNAGGDYSTNAGGNYSTNAGGYSSTNAGGDSSTNAGGNYSTNAGGNYSTNAGGYYSTNAGGNYSTNAGGYYSTAIGKDQSICAVREMGTIILDGKGSLGVAGKDSKAKGKKGSAFVLAEFDGDGNVIAVFPAIIDGVNIKEDTYYCVKNGKLVEVE